MQALTLEQAMKSRMRSRSNGRQEKTTPNECKGPEKAAEEKGQPTR